LRSTLRPSLILVILLLVCAPDGSAGNIRDTKHNLSISGPGGITSSSEDRICIFCHAPRKSMRADPFLWNRRGGDVRYIPYRSSTLNARVGQPTGVSKLCLSCHDGTIALGALISEPREIPFRGGVRFLPYDRPGRLGTDLSDDHPISFVYNTRLASKNRDLKDPLMLPPEIHLDRNGQLQCTACHDPHDDTYGKFLVMSNHYSRLCIACHDIKGWATASHSVSYAGLNKAASGQWPNTDYHTVAENGCENCHRPHSAGGHERLLNHVFEEDNCLICHRGNVAASDIELELTKPHGHPVHNYSGVHDAAEGRTTRYLPKHVECMDCHNPHVANDDAGPGAPFVSGPNQGVQGIDISGQSITSSQYQYEICFKCHADFSVIKSLPLVRQINQINTRLEFQPGNPSFHPVVASGRNLDVPSLLHPYSTNSIISCIDCHGSDDSGGTKGPHGSVYKFLLVNRYKIEDHTRESAYSYALCYKCHSRSSILSNQSFKYHRDHIVDQQASCAVCHDPHGVSSTQGNQSANSHLINFEVTSVRPDNLGRLYFQDLGRFAGQCFLSCHGKIHEVASYP